MQTDQPGSIPMMSGQLAVAKPKNSKLRATCPFLNGDNGFSLGTNFHETSQYFGNFLPYFVHSIFFLNACF